MPSNYSSTDLTPEQEILKKFQKALGKSAQYAKLKLNSKTPKGSFKPGKRNRYVRIPKDHSYGVIPQDKLFILDLDQHREGYWDLDQQIDFFSDFFKVNLRESLAVITPSGGVHIYLKFPSEYSNEQIAELIPKGSLRSYNDAFTYTSGYDVRVDADIRSGFSNGYVVGPGNFVNPEQKTQYKRYFLANESFGFKNPSYEILTVDNSSMENLNRIVSFYKQSKSDSRNSSTNKTSNKIDVKDAINTVKKPLSYDSSFVEKEILNEMTVGENETVDLIHAIPSPDIINSLRKNLANKDIDTFHQARAVIKASLHCCYDNYSIAMACIELGVDKDSYRKESLGFRHLINDINHFKLLKRYHNNYCYEGKKRLKDLKQQKLANGKEEFQKSSFTSEDYREYNKKKLAEKKKIQRANNSKFAKPRVLDISKISEDLIKESRKKKLSQQYKDAMNIVNYYIQPLSNVGAIRILLAHSDISERLGISSSRVSQAMRILRENEVIRIEQKQRTGLAATYSVPEKYSHTFLSKALRLAWGKYNSEEYYDYPHPIYFNFVKKQFETVFTNQRVEPLSDFTSWLDTISNNLPESLVLEDYRAGAAERYLVSEREALGYNKNKESTDSSTHTDSNFDKDEPTYIYEEDGSEINTLTGEIVEPTYKKNQNSLKEDGFDMLFDLIEDNDSVDNEESFNSEWVLNNSS